MALEFPHSKAEIWTILRDNFKTVRDIISIIH